jgi:Cys-tRNA synthase (O-phospho-L-seryl-tRNA:Cys-tRNA synthase)
MILHLTITGTTITEVRLTLTNTIRTFTIEITINVVYTVGMTDIKGKLIGKMDHLVGTIHLSLKTKLETLGQHWIMTMKGGSEKED